MRYAFLSLVAIFITLVVTAQEPFNGKITRIDGTGVRATIKVVDSDKVTRSDGKGRFGLTDVKADDALYIICRRDTILIAVEGRKSMSIVLTEQGETYSVNSSEELENYGFGYVKRRETTDFTSGISGDRLRTMGTSNLLEAILMCCPSLRYINGELCLRTQNSIGSSSEVLVLCDGMESRLEYISIYDVKSVEVLKSSNMYGFRGVNGVVLVTTYTGKEALERKR
ncbi:MAG: TonB-dependent receptor plug domain-containing protein [Alistipes sp.]|nr:TonB-dependent receptor plug domain-containing protein [Alistipes sp.]